MPITSLAYLGDAALEVMVRRRLITEETGKAHPSSRALNYVTAPKQSAALELILPHLTEDELDVYKRGRNCIHSGVPKHATMGEYRRATGFECIFGYLDIIGETARAEELFALAYPIPTSDEAAE